MRYLPRHTDQAAYFEVFTQQPITINEHKVCMHPHLTYYNFTDLRSDNLQRWTGQCCVECGRLLTKEPVR